MTGSSPPSIVPGMAQTSDRATRFDLVMTVLGSLAFLLAVLGMLGDQLEYYDVIAARPIPEVAEMIARVAAALFLITGVGGIHGRQKDRAGVLSAVGYVVIVIGLLMFAADIVHWTLGTGGWLLVHIGAVLFGISALRAGVLSVLGARSLAVGVPLVFVGGIVLESAVGGEQGWGPFLASVVIAVGLVVLAIPRRTATV